MEIKSLSARTLIQSFTQSRRSFDNVRIEQRSNLEQPAVSQNSVLRNSDKKLENKTSPSVQNSPTNTVAPTGTARRSLKGDLDGNGRIDERDSEAFVMALSDPTQYAKTYKKGDIRNGDMNGDKKIDFNDIEPFHAILLQRQSSAVENRPQEIADSAPVTTDAVRVEAPITPRAGDIDGDGRIGDQDVSAFTKALSNREEFIKQYGQEGLKRADISGDGSVDFNDIDSFQKLVTE